jgi:hypothetical protein
MKKRAVADRNGGAGNEATAVGEPPEQSWFGN